MDTDAKTQGRVAPWNKGKLLGQKPPLKLKVLCSGVKGTMAPNNRLQRTALPRRR